MELILFVKGPKQFRQWTGIFASCDEDVNTFETHIMTNLAKYSPLTRDAVVIHRHNCIDSAKLRGDIIRFYQHEHHLPMNDEQRDAGWIRNTGGKKNILRLIAGALEPIEVGQRVRAEIHTIDAIPYKDDVETEYDD